MAEQPKVPHGPKCNCVECAFQHKMERAIVDLPPAKQEQINQILYDYEIDKIQEDALQQDLERKQRFMESMMNDTT